MARDSPAMYDNVIESGIDAVLWTDTKETGQ